MDKKDSCEKDAYVRSFTVLEDNFRQTLFAFCNSSHGGRIKEVNYKENKGWRLQNVVVA